MSTTALRLAHILSTHDISQLSAQEQGVYRTFASLLWRRQTGKVLRSISSDQREEFIRDYAFLLTLLRLTATEQDIRDELMQTFLQKYPSVEGMNLL